jgi:hypothetical protein
MGETTTYRSPFSRVLAGVTVAVCGVLAVWLLVDDGLTKMLRYLPALALVALLAWQAYWRPRVEVSDGGVEIRNVWRTVHVPWPALEEVEGRLGLRLVTAYGAYQAWAVPAPRRTSRRAAVPAPEDTRAPTTEAAELVRARWRLLQAAGYLDDPRLERPTARTRVHVLPLALAVVLAALTVWSALG